MRSIFPGGRVGEGERKIRGRESAEGTEKVINSGERKQEVADVG